LTVDGPGDAEPIRVSLRPLGTPLPLGFVGLADDDLPLVRREPGVRPQL
jgi:hypothetical protein